MCTWSRLPVQMVTTRQIAREAVLSHAAVAAALKNSNRRVPEIRRRVLEMATRLRWRPNPMVEAFQKSIVRGDLPEAAHVIALIVDIPQAENFWQIPAAPEAATPRAAASWPDNLDPSCFRISPVETAPLLWLGRRCSGRMNPSREGVARYGRNCGPRAQARNLDLSAG